MNKDLLLGIGLGLLIAAILIVVIPEQPQSLTDLEVIEAARELGMSFPE